MLMWSQFVQFNNSILSDNVVGSALYLVASIAAMIMCIHEIWGHGYTILAEGSGGFVRVLM